MNKEKSYAHIVAGGVSGVFVSIATQPFDVLKTNLIGARERNPLFTNGKMQNQLQGTISFISTIYKTEVSVYFREKRKMTIPWNNM